MADKQDNGDSGSIDEFMELRKRQLADKVRQLDRDPTVRETAGVVADAAGIVAGVPIGVAHSVAGAAGGAQYAYRLANPLDPQHDAAVDALTGATKAAADYVQTATPQKVGADVQNAFHQFRIDNDPTATPMGATVGDEMKHAFHLGENQGETAYNLAMLLGGATTAVKGMAEANTVMKAAGPAKFIEQGFSPGAAERLVQPYSGMGSHYYPRSGKLLGHQFPQLPKVLGDSPFNVLKPRGISQGDFYELHGAVDPGFHGTGLPKKFAGESWSRKAVGIEPYSVPGRLWHGAPPPLKMAVGATAVGAGASSLSYNPFTREN